MKLDEDFLFQVYATVAEIPFGKVSTYGDIAKLIGYDKNSRMVGRALRMAGLYGDYPCHRVVNAAGKLVVGWEEQRELLQIEGVIFTKNDRVDLKKHRWTV